MDKGGGEENVDEYCSSLFFLLDYCLEEKMVDVPSKVLSFNDFVIVGYSNSTSDKIVIISANSNSFKD